MYFHTWELDPEQPRISAGGRLTQLRHYRNLNKMRWVLEDYLSKYRFGSIADGLNLDLSGTALAAGHAETPAASALPLTMRPLTMRPLTMRPLIMRPLIMRPLMGLFICRDPFCLGLR